jgi:two-component system, chemotaxis family, protein-glutamate methylesterase/glutaminase
MISNHPIIVIGGSAGAIEPLIRIVQDLPEDFPAAVFVVIHRSRGPSQLAEILSRVGKLPVTYAENLMPVETGKIYIAPANHHLLLKNGHMELSTGPKVNLVRPAIDLLFQSAAHSYRNHVIGIILSGVLDDGTRGLFEIKRLGGITIAQDPTEAVFPQMPQNALQLTACDYVLPSSQVATVLLPLVQEPMKDLIMSSINDFEDINSSPNYEDVYKKGKPSTASCPECSGVLAEIEEGGIYFECRVGHRYSPQTLLEAQAEAAEISLWTALRALEEAYSFAMRLVKSADSDRLGMSKQLFERKAASYQRRAESVRRLLLGGDDSSEGYEKSG